MRVEWDLSPLYKGFDDPAFAADVEALKAAAQKLNALIPELETIDPLEGLRRGTAALEEFALLVDRVPVYPRLRTATNTGDNEAVSWQGKLGAIICSAAGAQAAYKQWAGQLPDLEALVSSDEQLRDYGFYYSQLADSACHLLSAGEESVLASMRLSGGNAWQAMRGVVTSNAKVDYRGKTMHLSAVRNLARDPDPEVRREAYEAELAAYEAIKTPVAHALNAIKLETIHECRMRGYASVLDWSLHQARMRRETLDAMFAAIDEFLPRLRRYFRAKARLLGYEGGLPWYELSAPVGRVGYTCTPEEAAQQVVQLFEGFDGEMARMMDTAFRDAWIDFYPRPGKRDGAFCSSVRSMGRSWILANFGGNLAGLGTLSHELGHAFHNICIREHRVLNKSYTRPVSETASTFNECVLYASVIANAGDKEEKLGLIESCLAHEVGLIVDIYSRFLFEKEVLERRADRFLSADELCDIMSRAQKQCYGDGLDHDKLHPYMWVCKPHYYSAFYYNYPYAFGQLFARGLHARYEAEGAAFVPKYKRLLYTTTVATVEDAARVADIELTDKGFWRDALASIGQLVDQFCALLEE